MRLIDADELKKKLHCMKYGATGKMVANTSGWMVSQRDIDNMSTIDAEPVIHARWISKDEQHQPEHLFNCHWKYVCSNCGWEDLHPLEDKFNYCPHCGAKMDELED